MIAEIEAGNVATVIVKDMSRLGRDYLKVGYYTEIFFVERDVRYIAINEAWTAQRATMILPLSEICLTIFTPKIPVKRYGQSRKRRAWQGNI